MRFLSLICAAALLAGCQGGTEGSSYDPAADSLKYEDEVHLRNVRQLTSGGNNAEAYFSFDGQKLVFQSDYSGWNVNCDQIFFTRLSEGPMHKRRPEMLSTGQGRTTCSYFMPGDSTIVYSSTHAQQLQCPEVPERRQGDAYVWPIYDTYDIYTADLQGNILDTLTTAEGYDAEPTVSPAGDKMVFTSLRSGDLELYTMNLDGSGLTQITDELGYDGGAFFSPDGSQIVFRASRPETPEEVSRYRELLDKGLVEPTDMELFVVNADGTDLRQVTDLGGANWAPYFHPSGEKIIFSSNHASPRGFPFNLYLVNLDGSGLERVTHDGVFDAFPMFSPDGSRLVFSSNRHNGQTDATNIFIADWVE